MNIVKHCHYLVAEVHMHYTFVSNWEEVELVYLFVSDGQEQVGRLKHCHCLVAEVHKHCTFLSNWCGGTSDGVS